MLAPTVNPLAAEAFDAGVSAVPDPVIVDHKPVPVTGALAAKAAVVRLHSVWSGPAADTVGEASTSMSISSKLAGQLPLLIVQRSVVVAPPIVKPLAAEVSEAGVSTDPEPLWVVRPLLL